jgi:hypothetical protein
VVTGALAGRFTAICTAVVGPTYTGSVPRDTWLESSVMSADPTTRYQVPHEPSDFLARIRAVVAVRSLPVSATMENGVSWSTSRTVSPPPTPARGWDTTTVSSATASWCRPEPGSPLTAQGATTTLAMMAVNRIVGAGRRGDIARWYVWARCY